MSDKILDLRQNDEFAILVDRNTSGHIIWSDIPNLDDNYVITILDADESGSTVYTYTTGSGITLNTGSNAITWSFGTELTDGSLGSEYRGRIESESKEIGTYLRIFFKVQIDH